MFICTATVAWLPKGHTIPKEAGVIIRSRNGDDDSGHSVDGTDGCSENSGHNMTLCQTWLPDGHGRTCDV